MPFIPAAAPSSVEYRTKPNPFDQPDARSFTTLAAESKKNSNHGSKFLKTYS